MMPKRLNRSELNRVKGYLQRNGLKSAYYKALERVARDRDEKNYLSAEMLSDSHETKKFSHRYKFSIIVPAYETNPRHLRGMLNSVVSQIYDNWELCIADASASDIVKNNIEAFFSDKEKYKDKVKYIKLFENNGISVNTNEALKLADGEYVAFLDHDDKLSEYALLEAMNTLDDGFEFSSGIVSNRFKLLYSDEDKFSDDRDEHFDFHIKPGFNLELLRTNNYICHLLIVRRELVNSVGGFDPEYDGAQDHDFILRISEQLKRYEIVHIPKILYHWRSHDKSTATNPYSKLYAYEAGKKAVKAHLDRLLTDADVTDTEHLGFYKVKYNVTAEELTKVEIMTYDEFSNTPVDIIQAADYEYIMILNDDIKPKSYEFIEDMLGYLKREEVGCVGGLVIGKNGKIESAGYEMDGDGRLVPMFSGLNMHFSGYLHRAKLSREADGVCTDCMMIKKSALNDGHGLNAEYLVIYSPYSVFKRK